MGSEDLTIELKKQIKESVRNLMNRQLLQDSPFPWSDDDVSRLTFDFEEERQLLIRAASVFPKQVVSSSTAVMGYSFQLKPDTDKLVWTFNFNVPDGVIMQASSRPLRATNATSDALTARITDTNMERLPELAGAFTTWIETHRRRILQWGVAMYLSDELLENCSSTSQLNWCWPGLLRYDRKGRYNKLSDRSYPRKAPDINAERMGWYRAVNEWLGMAAVSPENTKYCTHGSIKKGSGPSAGRFSIDTNTVIDSVRKHLDVLGIDKNNNVLTKK